jgi:2-isopropylmalate synthase
MDSKKASVSNGLADGNGKKIEILDTTMRDGAQARGIAFSVGDRMHLCRALDDFGIAFIEAGNPASNPKEAEFFQRVKTLKLTNARLAAFGSTRHKNTAVQHDPSVAALLGAETEVVVIFGKAWDLHAERVLGVTLQQNLDLIAETLCYFKQQGRMVIFDAEHFYDGYTRNPAYAMQVLAAAVQGGAERLVLCDTNGGKLPREIEAATAAVVAMYPGIVGVHCHDDIGMAVANTVSAVLSGVTHVQGTFLGYGERCGNANLSAIIPVLQAKAGYDCVPQASMETLTGTARAVAEISNVALDDRAPFVGYNAFAHKGGMHIDGVMKTPESFEHIDPAAVGNERQFLLSEVAGRSALARRIQSMFPGIDRNTPEITALTKKLKELEHEGFQFEGADGSFEVLARKYLAPYKPFFKVEYYKFIGEEPDGDTGLSAYGTVKVDVDGRKQVTGGEGDGPVHALDQALRKALEAFFPVLSEVHLTDYKVRVLDSRMAAAAKVRVIIETTDGEREWTTVGVSTDVINASMQALVDSMEYKLLHAAELEG